MNVAVDRVISSTVERRIATSVRFLDWSPLVLCELRFGIRRFTDIRTNTGAPRETLTARLCKLEDVGIIERRRYSEHPPRDEYFLAEAGEAVAPILTALRGWGERHARPRAER